MSTRDSLSDHDESKRPPFTPTVLNLRRTIPPSCGQRLILAVEAPAASRGSLHVSLDGRDISDWNNRSHLTGRQLGPPPSQAPNGATVFLSRDWSFSRAGRHTLRATGDGTIGREVSFEIVAWQGTGPKVRNVILLIGDGMGVAHRTAARIASRGLTEGRYRNGMLEMDQMQATGFVTTSSLSAMVTDSSPGASCYSTGNKGANNQEGVFPDNTDSETLKRTDPESEAFFDNPRVENISEYLRRERGMNLGLVTTADVTDATPAAFAVHTSNRNASTRIADDYFDRQTKCSRITGAVAVVRAEMNKRKAGSRSTPTNAKVDPTRDLSRNFKCGFTFMIPRCLLAVRLHSRGFSLSHRPLPVAFDNWVPRRGVTNVRDARLQGARGHKSLRTSPRASF